MTRKFILILAAIVLGICLLSGGCSATANNAKIQALKDMIKVSNPPASSVEQGTRVQDLVQDLDVVAQDQIEVKLYFGDKEGQRLVAENRQIDKTPGMARETIKELLKGPSQAEHTRLFPEGTRLLDINIKSDGTCIVDLSSEVRGFSNSQRGKLMIYSLVNTLGEYPTVKTVNVIIGGEQVQSLGSQVNLAVPLKPDYKL